MFEYELGFIGAGNMANALINGILKSDLYKKDRICASDIKEEALKKISEKFGIKVFSYNAELVKQSSIVILCVKPQNMKEALEEIKEAITDAHLVISIAAGVPIKAIAKILGNDIPVIRVMPNTPALVQKGMSAIAYGANVKQEYVNIALDIFNSVGETIVVDEQLIDVITAVSGSGPGFIFRIMECMVESAVRLGLNSSDANELVIQTFVGASFLAKESKESLSKLREMVTSPKGTTEAGLRVFEDKGLKDTIHEAIYAAYKRSIEIKREWEK